VNNFIRENWCEVSMKSKKKKKRQWQMRSQQEEILFIFNHIKVEREASIMMIEFCKKNMPWFHLQLASLSLQCNEQLLLLFLLLARGENLIIANECKLLRLQRP
jgi:hypothetical protein